MSKEKQRLAVVVGEAWAQRMVVKRRPEGVPLGGAWPGRPADVAILAAPLSDDASERRVLGSVILKNARRAWRELTRKPGRTGADRTKKK